jgi:ABC-type antimicrobial peptide transport system permease subunit
VVGLVLKSGLTMVAVGGLVGVAASLGLGQLLERFLFGVGGFDLISILAAPVLLTLIAALATYLPARRASRVDPVRALRTE